ncbi:hypothetical protein [Roseovarius arcticus]|uniref:hypothetical protein n=1 Tax=Roseovarius arcticus TaxID=2547404 RepID=UPI001110404D|nr:hypothetical protein [Roseovarius arcticus]
MIRRASLLGLIFVLFAPPAMALTLNFGVDSKWVGNNLQSEQGFTFDNSLAYSNGEQVLLHDDGGVISSTFKRDDGRRFSAHGASLGAYSLLYGAFAGAHPTGDTNLEYQLNGQLMHLDFIPTLSYLAEGFRNGNLVASITQIVAGPGSVGGMVNWGSLFQNLDQFRVSFLLPENRTTYAWQAWPGNGIVDLPYGAGDFACYEWCGEMSLDNLQVSMVPLPAAFPLLASGIFALMAFGWRRRKSTGRHQLT